LLVVLVVTAFALGANQFRSGRAKEPTPAPQKIPPEGIADNDTHGAIPGDPAKAESSLRRIWMWTRIYASRHPDLPSPDISKLMIDLRTAPAEYNLPEGRAGIKEIFKVFTNPDSKHSDDPTLRRRADSTFVYQFRRERPDGTPRRGIRNGGANEIVAFTPIYIHKNLRTFSDGRRKSNPVGFYIVLWEDGLVERIPYNRIVWAPYQGVFQPAFPGEAGIPKSAIPFNDLAKTVMARVTGRPRLNPGK
jgi:hypothetical protein